MTTMKNAAVIATVGIISFAVAQDGGTTRVSVATGGQQSVGGGSLAAVSADGRFVVFLSQATDLVPLDENGFEDAFVHDRLTNTTELVSVSSNGEQGNARSGLYRPSISGDGRYVVFASNATNLIESDTNGHWDVFLRDRLLGLTTRASVVTGGGETNSWSIAPVISADGRQVAFISRATNFGFGTPATPQGYIYDTATNQTRPISLNEVGTTMNSDVSELSISADGRYVTFTTLAPLVTGDTNFKTDAYLRDTMLGVTERVSVSSEETQGNQNSGRSTVSSDGSYVAFSSHAGNLVPDDTNFAYDVFVRDRLLGETVRVSVSTAGVQGNQESTMSYISGDGRIVAFATAATNLVGPDLNGDLDILYHDMKTGETTLASANTAGQQGSPGAFTPSVSSDGSVIAFTARATNLVPEDTNGTGDVFARDLAAHSLLPQGFQLFRGILNSGNLQSLVASDDDRMVLLPGPVFSSQEFPIQLWVDMTSPISEPSRLEVYVEFHSSSAAVVQGIDFYNSDIGVFVPIRMSNSTTFDRTVSGFVTESAGAYVSASGMVRARIRFKPQGPVFAYPWQARIDHVYAGAWR